MVLYYPFLGYKLGDSLEKLVCAFFSFLLFNYAAVNYRTYKVDIA